MDYDLQKAIQRELDERIPRGPRGSMQNAFRSYFYFFRSQSFSFDDSVSHALLQARKQDSEFAPKLSLGRESETACQYPEKTSGSGSTAWRRSLLSG